MHRKPELWRRLLSTNIRQVKEVVKPPVQRRPLRPVVPEKPARPGPDPKKKATVVLPRVNRPVTTQEQIAAAAAAAAEAAEASIDPLAVPSTRTLQLLALQRGVPFIGFGFMDNAIMIVSGDYIEMTIGVTLGISTLTAAALGNIIADVLGLNLGGVIEELSFKLGVPEPRLSKPQMEMGITRTVAFFGSTLGIAFGCLVGMLPLAVIALMKDGEADSSHRETVPREVLLALSQRVADVVHCERAVVYHVDPGSCTIVASYSNRNTNSATQPLPPFVTREVVQRVLASGEGVSLQTDYLVQYQQQGKGVTNSELVQSVMCLPVLDLEGRLIAVVAAVNKQQQQQQQQERAPTSNDKMGSSSNSSNSSSSRPPVGVVAFDEEDEKALGGVCAQVSAALINMHRRPEEQVSFLENLKLLRQHQHERPVRAIYQV